MLRRGEKAVYKCVTAPSLLEGGKPVYKCVTVPSLLEKKRKKPVYKCYCPVIVKKKKPVCKCVTVLSWLIATPAAVQRPHAPSVRAAAPISGSCGAVGDGDGALCSAAAALDRPDQSVRCMA